MLTTIINDARIFDGIGTEPYKTDVGLYDDRIVLIGNLAGRDAYQTVDAGGAALSPGFIDVHSHTDEGWLASEGAISKIAQGVTTEIGGNCGTSAGPLAGAAALRKRVEARRLGVDAEWNTLDEFFACVEHSGTALNVASLVGLGTTRSCISGDDDRRLDAAEIDRQAALVREAIEHGALGISSGLIYEPSRYADLDELTAMARAARDAGAARYVSHVRDEGDAVVEAIDEALEVGRRADVAVQCSHHKAAGRRNWGKVDRTLERIQRARASGLVAYADVYPYIASWTDLATILPLDIRSGGVDATIARLEDPPTAAAVQLALHLARGNAGGDTWHDILVTDVASERNAGLAGYRLDEIASMWRLSPPRAAIRLLIEERLAVQCAFFSMTEDDVATVLSAEFVCIGSDASARALHGRTARGVPHPRAFGCFPRVFGRFVRGRPVFTNSEAVRRMTSLPARIFGLRDRGTIAVGAFADLVVFDPDSIVDRATYERPATLSEGIRDVFVNGRRVFQNGAMTGERPGRVLRGGA